MRNKSFTIFSILLAISLFFTSCTQTENNKTETTAIQETSVANTTTESNTVATIKTTEPVKPSKQEALAILEAYGLDESEMRKAYVFDEDNLNSNNNKNYVLDRMCNSIDYFTTLQASYTKKVNNKTIWITYAIDRRIQKAKELVYSVSENDEKCTPTNYNYVDGDYHYKMNFGEEAKSKYEIDFVSPLDSQNIDAINQVTQFIGKPMAEELKKVTKEPNKNTSANNKADEAQYVDAATRQILYDATGKYLLNYGVFPPSISYGRSNKIALIRAEEHYLPQYYALSEMYPCGNWKIDGVESDGASATVQIKGTYLKNDDENLKRNYTLRIDKKTGILNSLHIYNQSGNLVEEWNTLKYTVDGEIDENIFDSIQIKN